MPILQNASSDLGDSPDPRLVRTLWQWLCVGVAALLMLPEARGATHLFGYGPFWLVLAPSLAQLLLHRHALAAAWRARLVRATPRRRRRFSRNGVPNKTRGPATASRRARPLRDIAAGR